MKPEIALTAESVGKIYENMEKRLAIVRKRLGRSLTLSEKILFSHLAEPDEQEFAPGEGLLKLIPDRVAMQDATAQMAVLQFAQGNIPGVKVPATIHCDHLIRAQKGADMDLQTALRENKEVYDFLRSASGKYGIGFWKPGSGIIHQIVFENYAFPGGLMIGTDSHTPNAGGLGMVAIGVGGADAVDVLAGLPWEVKHPKVLGVRLTGSLDGWASPKDVILYICGLLTVKGGTNRIVEYFGPGAASVSCTGKSTITNMGAEIGATTSVFPYDHMMEAYLNATNRQGAAEKAKKHAGLLRADEDVYENPEKYFENVLEIDLNKLEPYIVGPHSPDAARPVSKLAAEAKEKKYYGNISAVLIGSCTNSSYEDLGRAADVAAQAKASKLHMRSKFFVAPGSESIYETVKRDGQIKALEEIGAVLLANACGPCIGQWKREDIELGEKNSIITSFNRNFQKRNDGNGETMSFITSPEMAVAMGLSGDLGFNPLTDEIENADGKKIKLQPPKTADDVPRKGFVASLTGFIAPPADGSGVAIEIDPNSERLQLLEPFPAWDGKDLTDMPVLIKAKGKCTTDHISPAGIWLKYRGHLDRISDNLFLGAVNAYTGETGKGTNALTEEKSAPYPQVARFYKSKGIKWIAVGDENYGEGSSREHAAMSPRFLGAACIIARSFARIHETNLKKQGILPLVFTDPGDYDKIQETDRISVTGLKDLAPGKNIAAEIKRRDGMVFNIFLRHSLSEDQIKWFRAGSSLNYTMRK